MSLTTKTHIPDGTWTLLGNAILSGNEIKVLAIAAYEDDFESYSIGVTPTGWITVLGTLTVQSQAGQQVARQSNPGLWQGAYYNSADFDDGTLVIECVNTSGGRWNSLLGFNPSAANGYDIMFAPSNINRLYVGGIPTNMVGANTPLAVDRQSAENPTTPFLIKTHKFTQSGGNVEIRNWVDGDLKFDFLDNFKKWGSNKIGVQGFSGDTDYGFIKFYEIKTGGFSKVFTPQSITKLNRICLSRDLTAGRRKNLSEILEYNVDGGGWSAVPDDGFINVAATISVGVRANSTLENDYDASEDLSIISLDIEIDGVWDPDPLTPDPATNLAVEAVTRTDARVTWTDSANADFYRVYFNNVNDFNTASVGAFVEQGNGAGTISGLSPSTQYWFWVVAEAEAGALSAVAGPVTVTMPAPASDDLVIQDIKDALYAWAVARVAEVGSTATVIWEFGDGPRPALPFVVLNLIGPRMTGGSDHQSDTGVGDQIFIQQGMREITVSVNVYSSDDSLSLATKLHTSLNNKQYIDQLSADKIGIGAVNDVLDLSEFLETEWERRSQFDFIIFAALNEEYTSPIIDQVDYDNNILP
jgi:hypothetical protein